MNSCPSIDRAHGGEQPAAAPYDPDAPTPAGGIVSIVIPAHELSPRLGTLLQSLDSQARAVGSGKLEVIISDDGSAQPLAENPTGSYPRLEIVHVRSPVSRGPGAARNRGLERVSTVWVAFLDSDTVPRPGWLSCLLSRISEPDPPDGLEGRVEAPKIETTPFTHATRIQAPDGLHGGANIAYRTEVIRDIGGFSEAFYDPKRKLHFREDTELRFRMAEHGTSIAYEPSLVVDHPPLPGSFWTPLRLARRYYFDPLLSSTYPEQFQTMNAKRSILGYSLRRARHDAALAVVLGTVIGGVGAIMGATIIVGVGLIVWAMGLLGSGIALFWGRKVTLGRLAPVALAASIVPWVYVYHYYRGVVRFRHFARM